jgi:hypothetical protein
MEYSPSERVVETAKSLNHVLTAGVGLLAVVALLRAFGAADFTWAGVKLAVAYAWIVAIAFTVAHAWVASDYVQQVDEAWEEQTVDENKLLFRSLTSTTGIFLRGLQPRLDATQPLAGGPRYYRMNMRDPSAWVALVSALTLIVALFPPTSRGVRGFLDNAALMLFLLWANWLIGTGWAVATSLLTIDRAASLFDVSGVRGFLNEVFKSGGSFPSQIFMTTFLYCLVFVLLLVGAVGADLLQARGLPVGLVNVIAVLSRCCLAYLLSRLVLGIVANFSAALRSTPRNALLVLTAVFLLGGSIIWIAGSSSTLQSVGMWVERFV